jgi:hypothetical protein
MMPDLSDIGAQQSSFRPSGVGMAKALKVVFRRRAMVRDNK